MKRLLLTTGSLLLLLTLAATAPASQTARTFMDGAEAYRNGDWPAAIVAFESLADGGVNNGKLYYNIGNAYLKNDDLGRALLWYERALKRIPDDPDLRFNYDYALTLTKDEQGEKESPLLRILFFWKYQLSHSTVRWIAILLNAALWTVLSVLVIRKKRLLRPTVILLVAGTVIFSGTAAFNYVEATQFRHAVILPEQAAVRSGFTDTATQLFVLHAGTKVRVERESETHLLIRYTEDKMGWVKKADAGMI
ncbi:MAG: tetratricopeptide repeat protein [Desulfosarcina sp.]|nr:tetratricopeptide repeat protein [Desulfosarcina sp.]MBC2743781.1 tetratricopeptide repeat protein [Desulfosarcina sp.]MBC2766690.1 tetratricopeptide repeat protein [Desulfosarcina sp.]